MKNYIEDWEQNWRKQASGGGVQRPSWDDLPGGGWAGEANKQQGNMLKQKIQETTGTNLTSGEQPMPTRKQEMAAAVSPSIYEPKYTSNVTGGSYEGSNMEIMDQVVADKIKRQEESGKYAKKGFLAKTRGGLEKWADTMAGGDYQFGKGYKTTQNDLKGKISKQLGKKEVAFQNEKVQSLADDLRTQQRGDTQLDREMVERMQERGIEGMKSFVDNNNSGFFDMPDYNALDDQAQGKNKNQQRFPGNSPFEPEVQLLNNNKNAFDMRLQNTGASSAETRRQTQIQDLAKSQIPFTGRFDADSQDGTKMTAYSDNKNMFYQNNDSKVLNNSNGESIGYSSGPGQFHFQEPNEQQLGKMGMSQDEFYQPNGNIHNKNMNNNQSALYRYGGMQDVPMVGKKSGPYADESQSVAQSWQGGAQDPSRILGANYRQASGSEIDPGFSQAPSGFDPSKREQPQNLMQQKEQEVNDPSVYSANNRRPIGAKGDDELMNHPLMQMDLGGADKFNKDLKGMGVPYWKRWMAGAVGPAAWGQQGKPFDPQKGY